MSTSFFLKTAQLSLNRRVKNIPLISINQVDIDESFKCPDEVPISVYEKKFSYK